MFFGADPALRQEVADGVRQRLKTFPWPCGFEANHIVEDQVSLVGSVGRSGELDWPAGVLLQEFRLCHVDGPVLNRAVR